MTDHRWTAADDVIARLRAEHVPVQRQMIDRYTDDLYTATRCDICHVGWPCPTTLTLDAARAALGDVDG